jgi:hypothetical protein
MSETATIKQLYEHYLGDQTSMFGDMDEAITIAEDRVTDHQRTQAEVYLHWARLHAYATNMLQRQDDYIKQEIWPEAKLRVTDGFIARKVKPTNTAVDEIAMSDREYRVQCSERAQLQDLVRHLDKMERALVQRASMLQSIGARQRVELSSLPEAELEEMKQRVEAMYAQKRGLGDTADE